MNHSGSGKSSRSRKKSVATFLVGTGVRRLREWLLKLPLWERLAICGGAIVVVIALIIGAVTAINHQMSVHELEERQAGIEKEFNFNPGNLISDDEFFDSAALSVSQIQEFLNQHGDKCSGSACLKNARFTVAHEAGDGLCEEYKESGKKSGAEIIHSVAATCGISQKVLLVMLEKEQGLVSTTEPSEQKFNSALGLSCPDTAACDKKYSGFFKQVYGAAHRFKYYQANPYEYSYHARSINYVQYAPSTACGGTDVYIENEATALLYIYTPYQPNSASLKAGWSTGDGCSSYGNRNFVKLYEAWFR